MRRRAMTWRGSVHLNGNKQDGTDIGREVPENRLQNEDEPLVRFASGNSYELCAERYSTRNCGTRVVF
jgi:hypothetical protein